MKKKKKNPLGYGAVKAVAKKKKKKTFLIIAS